MKLFGGRVQINLQSPKTSAERRLEKALSRDEFRAIASAIKNLGLNASFIEDSLSAYIDQGYLYNPDVYAIVRRISKRASKIQIKLFRFADESAKNDYASVSLEDKISDIAYARKFQDDIPKEEIQNHKIVELLKRPNQQMSAQEYFEQCYGYRLITGNNFQTGVGPDNGEIHELYIMPAHIVNIVPSGDFLEPVKGYKLAQQAQMIEAEDVLHTKYFNPSYSQGNSYLFGVSPLKVGSRVVTVSNDTYQANASLLQNLGAIGLLTKAHNEHNLTEEQTDRIQERWDSEQGPYNYGRVIVTSAMLKWQQLGMTIDDLGIIKAQDYTLRQLCNIYSVNSILFNDPNNNNYKENLAVAAKEMITNAVLPEVHDLVNGYNNWLVPRFNNERIFLDYDIKSIPELQPDMRLLSERLAREWWWSDNERREMMGKGALDFPGMDEPYVPGNFFQRSDQLMDEAEQILANYDYNRNGK